MSATPPAPNSLLPGLEALCVGRLSRDWAPLAGQGVGPGVRLLELIPGQRAVVALPARGDTPAGSLFLFPAPEQARAFFRQSLERVSQEGDVFLAREQGAVLWRHPFDPTLKALAALHDPNYRRDLLHALNQEPHGPTREPAASPDSQLVSWFPERHASLRVDAGAGAGRREVLVEVYPGASVEDVAHTHHLLEEQVQAGEPYRVPELLQYLEGRNLLVREWVPRATPDQWTTRWALRDLGRALARLHQAPLELPHRRAPPEEGDAIRRRAAELATLAPELEPRLHHVGERLGERICLLNLSPSSVMLNGAGASQVGWTDGQVVWREPGRARRGPAALDLGALKADLAETPESFEAVLQGYSGAGTTTPPSPWIAVGEAWAVFQQLDASLRTLAVDWPAAMSRTLARVECLLEEDPS